MLTSLLAAPALAEKAEVSTVAPTVVSRVWGSHQRRVKPSPEPVDPVALRLKTLHKRMTPPKTRWSDAELQELADSGDSLAAFFMPVGWKTAARGKHCLPPCITTRWPAIWAANLPCTG